MKRVILLLLLPVQILFTQTVSEWITLNSNTTNYLNFVHFPTENVGYVVGEQGTILKTTNSGLNWTTLSSGTNRWLSGVFFTSESVGYASGDLNTLLKTTNGGSSWFLLSTSSSYDMQAVFFVNDNIGFITDDDGKIWKTTNAGANWNLVYDTGGSALYSLYFLDNSLGFACGVQGKFLKTTDGGDSWSLSIIEAGVPLNKVQFIDNSVGYIVANYHVYKTTNGGLNWIEIRPQDIDFMAVFFTNVNKGFIGGWQGYVYRTTNGGVSWSNQNVPHYDYINSMFFINENKGYAVGGQGQILQFLYKEVVLLVPNGGEIWQVGSTYNIEWSEINVTNLDIEYQPGNGSSWINIVSNYPSSSGSFPWQVPNSPSNYCKVRIKDSNNSSVYDISDGTFTISPVITVTSPNGGELWHIGSNKDITWNSQNVINVKIDYTTDNGNSWNLISSSVPASNGVYAWTIPNTISSSCKVKISDVSDLTNYDLSDNVFSIIQYPSITVENPNGGEIFEGTVPISIQFNSIAVDSIMIHYSTDAGTSWIMICSSAPANGNYNWIVPNVNSQNCLIKITDTEDINNFDISNNVFEILSVGWSPQNSNVLKNLNSIDMMDSTLGYSCGDDGTIIKTTNGGESWEIILTGVVDDLNSIRFVSENIGWIVGQNGLIIKTTNRGLSWSYQNSNTSSTLNSAIFINQNMGLTVGLDGVILKTSDAGNNWISQQSNVSVSLNSIFFKTSDLGWIVGNSGTYLKTTNGGNTWIQQTVGTSANLNSIFFNDNLNGFIVGNTGTILLTVDGGEVWTNVSTVYRNLFSISFANNETGFIVANHGVIYKTIDSGFNWFRIGSGLYQLNYDLFDVDFVNLYTGWAVGEYGSILKTTNGGSTFGTTTLIANAFSGSQTLEVASINGFLIGDNITINPGGQNEETNTITGFGSMFLQTPLQFDHFIGEVIINYAVVSLEEERIKEIPNIYNLSLNYPNPFNPSTVIRYSIPQSTNVLLRIFDILGNEIITLVNEVKPIGNYEITWYADGLPSGIYFYRLQAGSFVETKKMVLLR